MEVAKAVKGDFIQLNILAKYKETSITFA